VTQVYLERRVGMDFLAVQDAVAVHFIALVLSATVFTVGIALFIYDFIQYGAPSEEMVGAPDDATLAADPAK
jgi:nitric oxide reductase subunit B